jgi:outer membrane protein assembly factor BamB
MIHLLIAAIFVQPAIAPWPEPPILWETDAGSKITAGPEYYPSSHAPTGVLAGTEEGALLMLSGAGEILWQTGFDEAVYASPAVGDITGDGQPDIVIGASREVIALTGGGEELWRYTMAGTVREWRAPVLADVTGDGRLEVLVSDEAGWQVCLDGEGVALWRMSADRFRNGAAAVLGRGPDATIFYGTENDHIVALHADGRIRWISEQTGQFGRTAPVVADLEGDGAYEVLVFVSFNTPNSRLICLDANTGALKWEVPTILHGYAAIGVADLEEDGILEVFLTDRSNTVYCFNADGTRRWANTTGGHSYMLPPAVADLTGDGRCEVISGVRTGNERGESWFILNDAGELLGAYPMPGGAACTPLAADFTGNGKMDVILPGTDAGIVRCYGFEGPAEGARRPWASPRGNSARTGAVGVGPLAKASVRDTPGALNVAWDGPPQWGMNTLRLAYAGELPGVFYLETAVAAPSGRQDAYVQTVYSNVMPDTVSVELLGTGRHAVSVRLYNDADPVPLAEWSDTARLRGVSSLEAAVRTELDALASAARAVAGTAPHTAQLLLQHQASRFGALEALSERVAAVDLTHAPSADAVAGELRAFREGIAHDLILAEFAQRMQDAAPGAPFALWEDPNPWDETHPLHTQPVAQDGAEVDLWLFGSEFESRAFHAVNLTEAPLTLQVLPSPDAIPHLRLYELVSVPRKDGAWVPDALNPLGGAYTLRLGAGGTATLWMTVDGPSLKPGIQPLTVSVRALGYPEFAAQLTLNAEVLPLSMADMPAFPACNWSSPSRFRGRGLDAAVSTQNALDHGIRIFTSSMPRRRADANGNLTGETDWSWFDTELDLIGPEGFILLHGEGPVMPDGVERFGPEHVKAQRAWLTELTEHMEAKGWDGRWALYPVDEPGLFGGTRIALLAEIATHFKEALPTAPVYANPSGGVTQENMQPLLPVVDFWCPELQLLRRQPELAEFFLATGDPVWSYEAPPEVKSLLPLGYYRANAWMGVQLGLHGGGFWTQAFENNDLWLPKDFYEYGANYLAARTEVVSRRYEAYRDGLEDARALKLLEQRLAGGNENPPAFEARARKLLEETIPEATRAAWVSNDITREIRDYELDFETVRQVREELRELLTQ